ncbi:nitroreductase family protein [Streptomyces yaizuensis]|uniref:TpaF n=1 Tax=Streptomyces yaizuensis TaxID=2989713 RepID=A0ABQ5P459_9ACTN|nr:tpaF [Streptomyces sp. YSPA8]GLF97391.1 tpaF [Streptomyces sp. YSPA8]
MRNDLAALMPVLEGFSSRTSTSDGRAAERGPVPFANAVPAEPAEPLAEELRPVHDLRDTLLRRRSTMHYGDGPVRTDVVLSHLREALEQDRADWGMDAEAGELEAFVFAFRGEGAPPGVYRVTAGDCSHLAGPDEVGPPENLVLQREFAAAAGIVAVYANLDRADTWAGSHGYRVCAVRAAMATYDFHLRCQAAGLVGSLFGGLIPSAVRGLVHSDGVTRHPLLATTYARP